MAWDQAAQQERSQIVWASQSQCRQRAGRTGRTCPGTVYRMLPRAAFLRLPKFEAPAVTICSLRRETLMLCCSESKAMNDPAALFARCMDPPAPAVVHDACAYLQKVR